MNIVCIKKKGDTKMAIASKTKRLRAIDRVIAKAKGSKRGRFEGKRAFVEGLPSNVVFIKGPKVVAEEGGYK